MSSKPGAIIDGEWWGWKKIRGIVFERDDGICQVCGRELTPNRYECGHKVDRVSGGNDHPDNLVVMCGTCNRLKPKHRTEEEYEVWIDNGFWIGEVVRMLVLPEGKEKVTSDIIEEKEARDGN